ncbi:MAG: hypothetical protein H6537_10340 [Bacteroidales bacterium]|nr:hypothetical protein [Bacteroidales bacterium]
MKKFGTIVLILVSIIVVLFTSLFLLWKYQPVKKLNVYVLDKTVPNSSRQEHKAFVWLLNQDRYVAPDGSSYDVDKDYWGFFPIDIKNQLFDFKALRLNEVSAYASVYDMAYYTDCYGVYSFEWYRNGASPIKSSKVYGGLNQNDYLLLKSMNEMGKLIIGEYNMLSYPTNALTRAKAEDLFNIEWTGWTGKYFQSLSTARKNGPPSWMPKLYESQHLKPWPGDQSGIVMLSNDGLVELLLMGEDLKSELPVVTLNVQGIDAFGNLDVVKYPCWFEFVVAGADAQVYATYELMTTDAGNSKLTSLGLSNIFPAVVRAHPSEYTYYFAGDFAEEPVYSFTSKLKGGSFINRLLTGKSDRSAFFNNFYTPVMNSILGDYYTHKEMVNTPKE